jgi:hypothetical protein
MNEEEILRQDSLGRALRALPDARAPQTLAPRVMAAVAERLRAPLAPTWFDWPVAAQVASVLGFLLLVAGAAMVWPTVAGSVARVQEFEVVRVLAVLWRTVYQPAVSLLLVVLTVLGLVGATCGALLERVACGGSSR